MSGPPWIPGKTIESISFGETLFAKNDATARSAQTLVRGGGDELRVRDWTGMLPSRDQPGDVRHIDEKNRAD